MSLKSKWKDLIDGESFVEVEPINDIAHAVIKNENELVDVKEISERNEQDIAVSKDAISVNRSEISVLQSKVAKSDKRLENLEKGLPSERFVIDDTIAYSKGAPSNACPYAMIEKVGGMSYREGDSLKHTKITAVESVGKNFLNLSSIKGTSVSANGGTLTCGADGGITGSGIVTGYLSFDAIRLDLPVGEYVLSISGNSSNIACAVNLRDANGNILFTQGMTAGYSAKVFNIADYPTYSYADFAIKRHNNTALSGTAYFQLERGTVATEYKPFRDKISFPIPQEVQELGGYGMGLDDINYNGIEWRDGKVWYVQRVAQDDNGNVYVLDEAIETEIDDIITTDNFIEVEPNGTIVFANENVELVPSTIIYQVRGEV